jgi:hypothetical protein
MLDARYVHMLVNKLAFDGETAESLERMPTEEKARRVMAVYDRCTPEARAVLRGEDGPPIPISPRNRMRGNHRAKQQGLRRNAAG